MSTKFLPGILDTALSQNEAGVLLGQEADFASILESSVPRSLGCGRDLGGVSPRGSLRVSGCVCGQDAGVPHADDREHTRACGSAGQ